MTAILIKKDLEQFDKNCCLFNVLLDTYRKLHRTEQNRNFTIKLRPINDIMIFLLMPVLYILDSDREELCATLFRWKITRHCIRI